MPSHTPVLHIFPLFLPGQIVATPAALELLQQHHEAPGTFVRRHLQGDWGDVCPEDAELNNDAPELGQRVHSAYALGPSNDKLRVITESDRSVTTLLLPEDANDAGPTRDLSRQKL